MTIDDLSTTARLWIEDHRLPEPDSIKVSRATERIELTFLGPTTNMPDLAWRDSLDGTCRIHESGVNGVTVSVYALKSAVAV